MCRPLFHHLFFVRVLCLESWRNAEQRIARAYDPILWGTGLLLKVLNPYCAVSGYFKGNKWLFECDSKRHECQSVFPFPIDECFRKHSFFTIWLIFVMNWPGPARPTYSFTTYLSNRWNFFFEISTKHVQLFWNFHIRVSKQHLEMFWNWMISP